MKQSEEEKQELLKKIGEKVREHTRQLNSGPQPSTIARKKRIEKMLNKSRRK